ncbi:MAG: RnfABCDGE type electron transport complex subunit D [Kosmotoga sp.]|uniref:RnfABCDGE type electron transport complex subunit D n=1 Tax=Kosmotoga sp. TaxID=1955248 RepID=UPI00345C1A80|nr:RnfABCDGE type electron transport complex subunit D [Kosmotoga sp.]
MKLTVVAAPHLRSKDNVRKVMIDVLIALIPASVAAVVLFGMQALLLIVVSMVSAELIELFIMRVLREKKDFKPDFSASVTGLLLALNLSLAVSWWQAVIGAVVAIGIAKHVFGGLGKNFWNPALIGRVFLLMSFPVQMTTWFKPFDLETTATPMAILKEGGGSLPSLKDMFIGTIPGSLGEVSALLLLIGFVYLVLRGRIKLLIPLSYVGSVALISWIFYTVNSSYGSPLYHILGGGLMLGALFMATDMVTSPMSPLGQLIFGIGCGFITMIIRYFGGYPEGVSFSILIMNSFVPLIDMATRPRRFGEVRGNA